MDAHERRLAESDLGTNYWVEAGAGTGKTTLLIRRMLNIVIQGAARLEEIAAITFTEKAAAELKARLRDELEKKAAEATSTEGQARIRRALEELETAPISTIHSFAALLLRERPVEAAVDPHFKIYEPGDMDDLLEQVWENWFFTELAAGSEVLDRALMLGVTPKRLQELGTLLYHQRDLVAEGNTPVPPDLLPIFLNRLFVSLPELKALLPFCRNHEDRGYRHLMALIALSERFFKISDPLEKVIFFLGKIPSIAARGSQKNWHSPEQCRRQKEICSELKQAQEGACRSIWGRLTADLVHWCRGFLAAVEQAKDDAGALDFQDLLLRARNLLRDSKEVRGYFQQRFRYLLVDEFQDTDPLQVDLVFLMAEKEPRAASWQEAALAPGKLFLVGDPKQSIYRFRRADIEIYQLARHHLLQFGKALAITQNFRTLPGLIEWVNRLFSILIKPQGNFQPSYQPLSAYRPPHARPSVVLLNPSLSLDDAKADEIRAAEAVAVGSFIEEARGRWMIPAGEGEARPLRYGDIALLFPTTTGIYFFEEALRRRGIPYRLEGGRQFYLREEIAFLKNLLTSVSNPHDQIALVAVLRYWAGIPDEMLFQYTESGGVLNYFAEAGAGFPRLQQAFGMLRRAHDQQKKVAVAELVEKLLEQTWYWQRTSLGPQGRQAAGNLRKVLQIIRALEMERPLTLKNYVNRLSRIAEQGREEAESLIHDPGSDSVQLLTIHKSKGLEFPAVCLVNMGGQSRGGSPFMAHRSSGNFYLKLGELAGAGVEEAEKQEALRLEAEQVRLFYVAATRARDYLILPRFYKSGTGGFWSYLESAEKEVKDFWSGAVSLKAGGDAAGLLEKTFQESYTVDLPDESGNAVLDELIAERKRYFQELEAAISASAVPGPYVSAGALAGLDQNLAGDGEQGVSFSDEVTGSAAAGSVFGSAFHQLMDCIDLRSVPSPEVLSADAARVALHWGIGDESELIRLAGITLEHPLMYRAGLAKELYKELPFSYSFEGIQVEGVIDLVFQEDEKLVIVDYKTDGVGAAELERRWPLYRGQGLIYAAALANITGRKVKEVSFLFVQKGLVKSIYNPDPASLDEMLRKNINRKGWEYIWRK